MCGGLLWEGGGLGFWPGVCVWGGKDFALVGGCHMESYGAALQLFCSMRFPVPVHKHDFDIIF